MSQIGKTVVVLFKFKLSYSQGRSLLLHWYSLIFFSVDWFLSIFSLNKRRVLFIFYWLVNRHCILFILLKDRLTNSCSLSACYSFKLLIFKLLDHSSSQCDAESWDRNNPKEKEDYPEVELSYLLTSINEEEVNRKIQIESKESNTAYQYRAQPFS